MEDRERRMYTLTRGKLAKFDETHMKKLQEFLQEGKIKDLEDLILGSKLSHNFSGTCYSISFRTSKPIILWSLGFWGPFIENEGDYQIKIVVAEINANSSSRTSISSHEIILEKFTTVAVKCQWRQIFRVDLPQNILLRPNKWIQIRFQLDGPETAVCEDVKGQYNCGDVEFQFLDSSHQLPQLIYSFP